MASTTQGIPWFTVQDADGKTMERSLPQAFPVSSELREFYVRECFDLLYTRISHAMGLDAKVPSDIRCTIVFGTPGSGKSIFGIYFFQRYITEHPNSVVFSSWAGLQKQEEVLYSAKTKKYTLVDPKSVVVPKLRLCDGASDPKSVVVPKLRLCDGASGFNYYEPTVCFTSLNFEHLSIFVRKRTDTCGILMPNWTLEELLDANDDLELATDEEIRTRCENYGPIARVVLQREEKYRLQAKGVRQGLAKIKNWEDIQAFFRLSLEKYDEEKENVAVHRLVIIEPNPFEDLELWDGFQLKFASRYLAECVMEKCGAVSEMERKHLYDWLGDSGLAAGFRGFLYEWRCHDIIKNGVTLKRRRIRMRQQGEEEMHSEKKARNEEEDPADYVFVETSSLRFSDLMEVRDCFGYLIPKSHCMESSIDAIWHVEDPPVRMLLQMTISESGHPIKANGLVKYLEAMDIYDDVKENPALISINFVVHKKLDCAYRSLQKIEGIQSTNLSNDTLVSDLGSLKLGIRKKSIEKIIKMGINTMGVLKKRFEAKPEDFSFEKAKLQKLIDTMNAGGRDLKFLEEIPQYVIWCDE